MLSTTSNQQEMNNPILSLCLPTNGIIEWVFPVLNSIYAQNADEKLFEVVVTNNGDNEKFHEMMVTYAEKHKNLIYKKTNAYMFHNQLEALKLGTGHYLKLINHRATMIDGAVNWMLKMVNDNLDEKPVMYFSNGVMERNYLLNNFDDFVRCLGKYASWTTGVGIWKFDYEKLPADIKVDKISPHSCILFANRDNNKYKIIDNIFCEEIEKDNSKKGTYDLFKAFGVEELTITQNLYIDGDITAATLKKVKNDYRKFVADLYWDFMIRRKPCSYKLSGFDDAMGIYFNKYEVILRAYMVGMKRMIKKLGRKY